MAETVEESRRGDKKGPFTTLRGGIGDGGTQAKLSDTAVAAVRSSGISSHGLFHPQDLSGRVLHNRADVAVEIFGVRAVDEGSQAESPAPQIGHLRIAQKDLIRGVEVIRGSVTLMTAERS